jgi:hypothetical protein
MSNENKDEYDLNNEIKDGQSTSFVIKVCIVKVLSKT